MTFDLKQHTTDKIENIVKTAIEQMPSEATNIRLIEGYRQSSSGYPLFVTNCWTEVDAIYKDNTGHEITRIPTIDKVGGWQYSEPANYILYNMGLHQPINKDKLKTIKSRYEWQLDHDMIYPIHNVTSDAYNIRNLVDKIIKDNNKPEVVLTFVLDYNYFENGFGKNVKYDKREYCIKSRITTEDITYTSQDCRNFFDNTILLEECYHKLKEHGICVLVDYDMENNDWEFITSHWNNWW